VRRVSGQSSAATNSAKQNETKINTRPVTSRQQLANEKQQASRPAAITTPQKKEAVSRPARTFSQPATASPSNDDQRKTVTRSASIRKAGSEKN
jgi:hypothetical protein